MIRLPFQTERIVILHMADDNIIAEEAYVDSKCEGEISWQNVSGKSHTRRIIFRSFNFLIEALQSMHLYNDDIAIELAPYVLGQHE